MAIEVNGKSLEVDEEGYLSDLNQWEPEVATIMAHQDGHDLTDKGNSKYLYELFPYGPAKQACKYAGLPKPTGCV
jgi:tRNA 2-thiouridine synthesizing protein E